MLSDTSKQCAHVQVMDYLKIVYAGVRPLMSPFMLIPEYNLTYKPLPCNSTPNYFLDQILLYAVMIFQTDVSFDSRLTDTVCLTWLIVFTPTGAIAII